MSVIMLKDTAAAIGANAQHCDSRSLLLDRFVDPTAKEEVRKRHFTDAMCRSAKKSKIESWFLFSEHLIEKKNSTALHAQLQARLMVNMSGGLMENDGLCLDRYGMPYVPGSAVKGCARRAALAALREWCEAGQKPADDDNLFAESWAKLNAPADMLAAIALVFGWVDVDWKDSSDFAWACGNQKDPVWKDAAELLAKQFAWKIEPKYQLTPWQSLPNFAGRVAFMPAYPVDLGRIGNLDGLSYSIPEVGKLELDVVTSHHPDYYSRNIPLATDTEDPNPVIFPAVAPGHVFGFMLSPLRQCETTLIEYARVWLATGLSVFGIGAKTNAGYGWFDCSKEVNGSVVKIQTQKNAEIHQQMRDLETKRLEKERLAKATPEDQKKIEYLKMEDQKFADQAKRIEAMSDVEKLGFLSALGDSTKKETHKRWRKNKPELIKPWLEYSQKLNPQTQL